MRFIIIGGGGFGLELYTYILCDIRSGRLPANSAICVLDEVADCEVMRRIPELDYLGRVQEFIASEGDQALIAIGHVGNRKKTYRLAQERRIPMTTYIHSSAWVAPSAIIGQGCIVSPNCVISAYAEIADNVAMNVFSGVGHGAKVGAHCVMGPYSVINGDTSLGEGCYLGTRATLFPSVNLGKGCVVDTHSAVKASSGDFKIITVRGQYQVLDNRFAERSLD